MRNTFTLDELREAGAETIGNGVLLGVGAQRREFTAVRGVVTIDWLPLGAALLLGSKLTELEKPPNNPPPVRLKSPKKNTDLGIVETL